MRKLIYFCVGLLVLGLLGGASFWLIFGKGSEIAPVAAVDGAGFSQDQITLGAELVAVGDCVVCHTAKDGPPFAGGLALDTPFGVVYSTNITPDPQTGIGTWSQAAFLRSMRQGLDRQGNHLFPVFPYDQYAKVTDPDLLAIYAFLSVQSPVVLAPKPTELRFPFNLRPLMAIWKTLYLREDVFKADPKLTDEQNRGAYLVTGLGHCASCHAPRTLLGGIDSARHFEGGLAEGWSVPAIGAASHAAVPWSATAYENYLFDGWDGAHGLAAGPMTAVINTLYDANEDDVAGMAAYMATLAPEPDPAGIAAQAEAASKHDWAEGEALGGANAPQEAALLHGEQVFARNCITCHKARVSDAQPISLGLSAVVNDDSVGNFLRVLQEGIVPARASRDRAMPAQAQKLSAQEIADLAAFVRWRFTDLPAWSDTTRTVPSDAHQTGGG